MVNIVTLPFQLLPQHQSLVQIPKPKQLLIVRLIPKLILARSCSNVCTHPVLTAWNLTWEGFTSPRIGLFPSPMHAIHKEWAPFQRMNLCICFICFNIPHFNSIDGLCFGLSSLLETKILGGAPSRKSETYPKTYLKTCLENPMSNPLVQVHHCQHSTRFISRKNKSQPQLPQG